jgi:hypothetical protein
MEGCAKIVYLKCHNWQTGQKQTKMNTQTHSVWHILTSRIWIPWCIKCEYLSMLATSCVCVCVYLQQQSGTGWKRMRTGKIVHLLLSHVVLKFLLPNKLGGIVVVLKTYWTPSFSLNSGFCGLVVSMLASGTGGLVVSVLASGTRVRGRSRLIFSGVKLLSVPSFGREVKLWVPCRRFAAR